MAHLPRRRSDLLVEKLASELVIYDPVRHRGHCLNRTARLVWKSCDGRNDVARLTSILQKELQSPITEEVVWAALGQLSKASLLEERVVTPAQFSRRELASAAAGILAIVVSLGVPTPAMAATCFPNNDPRPCTSDSQCCNQCCKKDNTGGECHCKPGGGACGCFAALNLKRSTR